MVVSHEAIINASHIILKCLFTSVFVLWESIRIQKFVGHIGCNDTTSSYDPNNMATHTTWWFEE